ncbi:hypothetical protein MYXO_01793 [Myxococcaceae bacterium]|nr:hypothetical protein MYXO_01793 [Myxococcaceae bacterium]
MNEPAPPFPGPLAAVWLTIGSWLATTFVLATLVEPLGPIAALGCGLTVGLGLTGTLAARRVPPPQAERIGLRSFKARLLPVLVLLVPSVVLVSELDNVVRTIVSSAEAGDGTTEPAFASGLEAIEALIVMVGILPVLEEFFFRGVLQQGLVALGGPVRGVIAAATLYALGHGNLAGSVAGWLSATAGGLVVGTLLGSVRLVSGSVLACVVLAMAIQAAGFGALRLEAWLPIPGFNAPGAHTPFAWLAGAGASVAFGLWLLLREARRNEPPDSR